MFSMTRETRVGHRPTWNSVSNDLLGASYSLHHVTLHVTKTTTSLNMLYYNRDYMKISNFDYTDCSFPCPCQYCLFGNILITLSAPKGHIFLW